MGFDPAIMSAALNRLRREKDRREAERERLTQEIYAKEPRLRAIDRELQSTAARIVLITFDAEGSSGQALTELRQRNLNLQRERAELLTSWGYSIDCLDEKPACSLCGDKGYLSDGSSCQCLRRLYTEEQNKRLSKLLDLGGQSFENFSLDWYESQIWPDYGCSPLENMKMVREICWNYAGQFSKDDMNLLFTGAPGLGKTFLSACIARVVSEKGFSVVYDTAGNVFQQFESRKFGRDDPYSEDPDREVNRYLNCDLLIMDDVGSEMNTSFVRAAFYQIVNDRLLNHRKTVLSTNLALSQIGERYGEAVLSRIRGEYQILRFFGKDIRPRKKG